MYLKGRNKAMSTLTGLGPVSDKNRIIALDITRGVALLGILLMNITGFGLDWMAYDDPTIQGGHEGKNLWVWMINFMFFEGTMRGLFSLLFGVGMILMTSRMEERGGGIEVADIYFRRNLWLLLFGIVHAYLLLWSGEILYAYAIFGMIIYGFRKMSVRNLILFAAMLTLFGFLLKLYSYSGHMEDYANYQLVNEIGEEAASEETIESKEAWDSFVKQMKTSEEEVAANTEAMHGNYISLVFFIAKYNHYMQTSFIYDYYTWDVLVMMLLGIALYKARVITAEKSYRYYGMMMLFGYGIGLTINYFELRQILDNDFSVVSFQNAGLTYLFGRIGVTVGHIGLLMIFCKLNILQFLRTSFAAVGKMALTNYVMHSVICAFVFYGIGFSLFGQLERYELYYVVFGIWAFQMIASPIWLKYYRYGPLEWLWRSLTYNKKQAFKK